MSENEDSRLNFANNCIKLVEEMDFDGIDIDWGKSYAVKCHKFIGQQYNSVFVSSD